MCTGDNLLTAVCVARECNIVHPQPLYLIDLDPITKSQLLIRRVDDDGKSCHKSTNKYRDRAHSTIIDLGMMRQQLRGSFDKHYVKYTLLGEDTQQDATPMIMTGAATMTDSTFDMVTADVHSQCAMTGLNPKNIPHSTLKINRFRRCIRAPPIGRVSVFDCRAANLLLSSVCTHGTRSES
jgi:magnesium-transporting ATPase (P-type)